MLTHWHHINYAQNNDYEKWKRKGLSLRHFQLNINCDDNLRCQ